MKVCEICGDEISTKDGDNRCADCEFIEDDTRTKTAKQRRRAASHQRRERESVLNDLGLVKVRGALGGTYWE